MIMRLPTLEIGQNRYGTFEKVCGDSFWFRLRDEDGYLIFEMNIPLLTPATEEQEKILLSVAIAKFKLCDSLR